MAIIRNEVVNALLDRRSIRRYKPNQISEDQLETILTCGFNAPSGGNTQSWFVAVVQDSKFIDEMHQVFVNTLPPLDKLPPIMSERMKDPEYNLVFRAPTAIFVFYDPEKSQLNSAILGQNMVIAAQSLGLGTCYLGGPMQIFGTPEGEEFMKRMNVPEGYKPSFGLAVGYPNENPEARPRDLTKFSRV